MVQANMLGALDEYLLFLFLFLCCVELKPPIPMSTIGVATICGKDVPKLFIMDEKGYTKSTAYIEGLAKFAYNDHLDLFTIPLLGIFEHPTKLFPKDDFFLCQRLNMLLFLFFITIFLRGGLVDCHSVFFCAGGTSEISLALLMCSYFEFSYPFCHRLSSHLRGVLVYFPNYLSVSVLE